MIESLPRATLATKREEIYPVAQRACTRLDTSPSGTDSGACSGP